MEQILATVRLEGIDYRESEELTTLGGFLMTFGDQRRITMNARLTEAVKARGVEDLLNYLAQVGQQKAIMYLWTCDAEPAGITTT